MHKRYLEEKLFPRFFLTASLFIITNISAVAYFSWLLLHIRPGFYPHLYLAVEIVLLIYFELTVISYMTMRFHRHVPPRKNFSPDVDVFIPCCGEDIRIIERTLEAAVKINYRNKEIYVLDDGKSPKLEALAKALKLKYITRNNRLHSKGGNLNNALEHSKGEYILVLDADQVARPHIINKLIGYFIREDIAFVQSSQQSKSPVDDPYNSQDAIFNRSVELSRDAANAVISCGSGVIYRRKAIEEIGGFSVWNIVEDLHTSYILQQAGYKGIFFNYALSKGIAPPDYGGVARQRHKWATDTLRIFFWDNPIFKKGLNLIQKINYLEIGFLYIYTGLCMPVFFILPIWSLMANQFVINRPVTEYLLFRLPYFILALILNNFIFRVRNMVKVYQSWNFFFPIFIQGALDALRNRHLKLEAIVTSKKEIASGDIPWWATARLQLIILAGYPIAFAVYALAYNFSNKALLFVNSLYMLWGIFLLAPLSFHVFLEQHQFSASTKKVFTRVSNHLPAFLVPAFILLCIFYFAPFQSGKSVAISKQEKKAELMLDNAREAVAQDETEWAAELYTVYLQLYPYDLTARREHANILHVRGDYELAAGEYKYLIDNGLAEKQDYLMYARVLNWQGNYDRSLEVYAGLSAEYPADQVIRSEYLLVKGEVAREVTEKRIVTAEVEEPTVFGQQLGSPVSVIGAAGIQEGIAFIRNFIPQFSLYWQDTVYRRLNEGFTLGLKENKDQQPFMFDFKYFFSELSNSDNHLNRNSVRFEVGKNLSDNLFLEASAGVNTYTQSVGSSATGKARVLYSHDQGNLGFEFHHYDIIDTVDIFIPRYYTLVTDVDAARHKISTNDLKLEAYQTLSPRWAFYGNIVYGMYSDDNIKKTLYASPIYSLNKELSLKYAFAFIDEKNTSPYYYRHNHSRIHQLGAEFTKELTPKLLFNTEEMISYDIEKGLGASAFLRLSRQLVDDISLDLSTLFSFSNDNEFDGHTYSLNFNVSLRHEF